MKGLFTALILICLSTVCLATEKPPTADTPQYTQGQLAEALANQEWRYAPDFWVAIASEGSEPPKAPDECIPGFTCTHSFVCGDGVCYNGQCVCLFP